MSPSPQNPVVFVDDEPAYTDLMSHMIGAHLDCQITTFEHPAAALAAFSRLQPRVVVTDYHMPDCTGLELIRQATKLLPNGAFILMTGHNLDGTERELQQLHALKRVLLKPFGWRTLADEIIRVWPATSLPAPAYRAPGRTPSPTLP